MKRMIAILVALLMLTACTGTLAEVPRNGGRGNGSGGASMQTLDEGIAYMNGDGVDQDYEKALQLFMEAYEAGSMKAVRYIGMMYEQGLGVEQDYKKAAEYYAKGVEAGDLTSGYYLGLLYEQGLGMEQDCAKAAELFATVEASENKSATGVVAAGYELGVLYEQGLGVEQDVNKAIELYQEAAEYEYPDAFEALKRLECVSKCREMQFRVDLAAFQGDFPQACWRQVKGNQRRNAGKDAENALPAF